MESANTSVSKRIEENVRLSRFFSKLFNEALLISCQSIDFSLEGENLLTTLVKGDAQIKSFPSKASWLEPMIQWLTWHADEPNSESFTLHFRLSESEIFAGRVERSSRLKNNKCFRISGISTLSVSKFLEHFSLLSYSEKPFSHLTKQKNGLILVSSPNPEDLRRSVSLILSLTGGIHGGELVAGVDRESIAKASRETIVVVEVRSEDSIDAILKLKEHDLDASRIPVLGSICQVFVGRTCDSCSRETIVDKSYLAQLPPSLVPNGKYLVGRGCTKCNHTGSSGQVAINSIVACLPEISPMIWDKAQHREFVKRAYHLGTKSLLEDGIRKIREGLTTFEFLYQKIKVLPIAYNGIATLNDHGIASEASTVSEETDFFSGAQKVEKPMHGRAAFSGIVNPIDAADDAPLFSVSQNKKVRPKPLLMIVEDDPDQREILDMVLKSSGYDVIGAGDGKEALELLKNDDEPDLIISDLMMPHMDGNEFVYRLKADPVLKTIPVIMLTVVSDAEKEYQLLSQGADDYCEKNVQRKILLKRVENLLKRSKSQGR